MLLQELNSLPKKGSTPSHYSSHLQNLVILQISFFPIFQIHHIFPIFFPFYPCDNTRSLAILSITPSYCHRFQIIMYFSNFPLFLYYNHNSNEEMESCFQLPYTSPSFSHFLYYIHTELN